MYGHRLAQYRRTHDRPLVRHAGLQKRKESGGKLKGKDGLEYFIPKYYAVRVYHGVKSKRLVPVIPNLVFVHASRIQITEFKKRYNFLQFVMWEKVRAWNISLFQMTRWRVLSGFHPNTKKISPTTIRMSSTFEKGAGYASTEVNSME